MFVPLPDPRFVEYILDVNDKGINIYMNELISQSLKKENNKAKRLILKLLFFFICKLGLTRYFVHGYSVIAQK